MRRLTIEFLDQWIPRGVSPLSGNSISQDRRFLRREMPDLDGFFHYRQIDVSTIKELVRRWYGEGYQPPPKAEAHRALDDVRESVRELRWYREHVFRAADAPATGTRSWRTLTRALGSRLTARLTRSS